MDLIVLRLMPLINYDDLYFLFEEGGLGTRDLEMLFLAIYGTLLLTRMNYGYVGHGKTSSNENAFGRCKYRVNVPRVGDLF